MHAIDQVPVDATVSADEGGTFTTSPAKDGRAVDRAALRVCADPNNMPYSNEAGEGFENKIAELFAALRHEDPSAPARRRLAGWSTSRWPIATRPPRK